jgi:hypothetical protein
MKSVIDGWFATDESGLPYLIPPLPSVQDVCVPTAVVAPPQPRLRERHTEAVALSRRGELWSYAENARQTHWLVSTRRTVRVEPVRKRGAQVVKHSRALCIRNMQNRPTFTS